ncbi:hypothetical protein [Cerasicoccus arenae]|uniref:Alpha-L-rhamnosidase n=1 Tax=Cerasicoccus arenae TaxID=424488 RepID=A0A8J3DK63_9BACT|nr:hypothetical protein [Cerasicoccus arenae]MBK1859234.1 hypothetical protein [Cerasicoccus arenae]GHC02760.1 hypothetical protein GCM10007047_19290 [Cerasicoccus arenae]
MNIDAKSMLPTEPTWIWARETHKNQTLLFRTQLQVPESLKSVDLQIAANTRYYLWVNGCYLSQGPCPAPKNQSIVDTYHLDCPGPSICIAVIVHYYGVDTQSHSSAKPGLWCQLVNRTGETDRTIDLPIENWRCLHQGGWIPTDCRRSWATAWVDQFDANRHPENWQAPEYNDADWETPIELTYTHATLAPREVPPLREWFQPAENLIAAAYVSNHADFPFDGAVKLGQVLDEEPWDMLSTQQLTKVCEAWSAGKGITAEASGKGLALLFDLGHEVAAQTEFDIEGKDGCVDHYGSERLRAGRPRAYVKDADYSGRWFPPSSGRVSSFRTLNYNGFRYLLIVLRPDKHPLHLRRCGAWRRQADLVRACEFTPKDYEEQSLWETSLHTIEVGTQETAIDCPTREQALYIGDGLWHSLWLNKLYQSPGHLHHFFDAIAASQHETSGLITPAVFRGAQPPVFLLDYCLIYVWGIDVYRRALPGNNSRVKATLESGERVLKWFEDRIGSSGLVETNPKSFGHGPEEDHGQLVFIDHPGMGWHMQNEPGMERSWIQQGLNAFLIIAVHAFLACAEACEYTHSLNLEKLSVERLREQSRKYFHHTKTGYFSDCVDENGKRKGWSEQSQILAVLSKMTTGDEAHEMIRQLIEARHDPKLCKCTPYFWIYYAEALKQSGHGSQIIELVKEAWGGMNSNPEVTCWWECFGGDELDSYCHPWSAVPAWLLHPDASEFRLCL